MIGMRSTRKVCTHCCKSFASTHIIRRGRESQEIFEMNVLITGGSRGIGRATALLAGERGWNVGVNYVSNEQAANATVEEVQQAGGKAIKLKCDCSKEEEVQSMFEQMEAAFGPLNGVVINAGITAKSLPLAEFDTERLRRVLDTNILGAYLCARDASRRLAQSDKHNRSIVFVSSVASKLGSPNEYVDYAGSKGAMDSLSIGLSKEIGPKQIRVNNVRPGMIKTDIHDHSGDPGRAERLGNLCPLGRA